MSFIPTSTARVQAFAGALYGVQAGSTTMAAVNRDIANNGEAATFNTYFTLSFGGLSSTQVAERLVTNLGITEAGFVAVNYVVGQLNGTPKAAWGAKVSEILSLFSALSADATFGAAATAWNQKVEAAVAYTGAADVAVGTVVSTFTLTAGVDATASQRSISELIAQPAFACESSRRTFKRVLVFSHSVSLQRNFSLNLDFNFLRKIKCLLRL